MAAYSTGRFSPAGDFWRGRRVFITGHTGFKGAWLALWLSEMGAVVRGYALAPTGEKSAFEALKVERRCEHQIADILDAASLARAVADFQPEVVIHMAAQALVRKSYAEPVDTFLVNVHGTVNVLQACRGLKGLKAVVSVTTDKCYRNVEWQWSYRECDPLGGDDPYSASKACAEIVTASWRQSFFPPDKHEEHGVAIATARSGNVIGGGDWSLDRLVPDAARAFGAESPLIVRMPQAVRPWQFVLEPLSGYLMLAQALIEEGAAFAEAWNFGPAGSQLLSVADMADAFSNAWGHPAKWRVETDAAAPHEAQLLLLDSGLANRRLGWEPAYDAQGAIAATAEWYKSARQGADMEAVSIAQLSAFSERIGVTDRP